VAKGNKGVDMTALMINALENQHKNQISPRQKKWAYLVSIGLPPFGLIFALVFYFGGKDDGKRQALICLILTIVAGVAGYFILQSMLSSAGTSVNQIQQLNPDDLQKLLR